MDHRLEQSLQVDPFRQAVGRHQDTLVLFAERVHAFGACVGGDAAVHGVHCDGSWKLVSQVCADVGGRVDEATEHDRVEAVRDELLHQLGDMAELVVVLRSTERGGSVSELEEAVVFGVGVGEHHPRDLVCRVGGVVCGVRIDDRVADLVGHTLLRRGGGAASQGGFCGSGRGCERPQKPHDGPLACCAGLVVCGF